MRARFKNILLGGVACAVLAVAVPAGAQTVDEAALARRLALIDDLEGPINRLLDAADAANASGDCASELRIVDHVDMFYSNMMREVQVGGRFPPGTLAPEIRRYQAARARVCPPPGVAETAPPMTMADAPAPVALPAPPQWQLDALSVQDQWQAELAGEPVAEGDGGDQDAPRPTPPPPPPRGEADAQHIADHAAGRPVAPPEPVDPEVAAMQERMLRESSGEPLPDTPAPSTPPPPQRTDAQAQAEYQADLLKQETDRVQFEQRYDLQRAAAAGAAALAAGDCPGRDAAIADLQAKINDIQSRFSDWNEADMTAAQTALDGLRAAPCPPPGVEPATIGSLPGSGTPVTAGTILQIGNFLHIRIAGDGQVFCTYGPAIPEPATPGSGTPDSDDPRDGPDSPDNDDPRDGPPRRPDVPEYGRTPEQDAAYYAWYNALGDYWAERDGLKEDANGYLPGHPLYEETPDDPRDEEVPEEDDPRDETPPITLIIKATTVAQSGVGQSAVGRTQAKLFPESVTNVALPSDGGARPQTDAGEDPVTCTTGDDGTCTVEIDPCDFGNCDYVLTVGQTPEVNLFTTESASYVLEMTGRGDVSSALQPYVIGQVNIDGTKHVIVMAGAGDDGLLQGLISHELGVTVANFEVNICRDKQPGPPPPDPLMQGAGSWGQEHDDQWAIKRVGLTLEADSAWAAVGPDAQPVTVAVIDTGLDWNHLDFSYDNIWKNPGEVADNRIDDDGNGYVDDIIGWDFLAGTNNPWDHDGHGTIVAGVIAADTGNDIGVAGINPHARIMVLKALNAFGHTRASYVAEAIVYAADNGARVINLSVGGPTLTRIETAAIAHARARGVVVVVAAGNEGVNVAEFGLAGADGVITVGATNLDDSHPNFSNWGPGVDIAAPGVDVLSLRARRTDTMLGIKDVPYEAGAAYVGEDRRYYRVSGTSFSAPIVAGVASLILSARPDLTAAQVETILIQSAEDIQTPGVDQFSGAGMVDARAALAMDPNVHVEAAITGLEVVQGPAGPVVRVQGTAGADRFRTARIDIGRGERPTAFTIVLPEVAAGAGVLGDIPADAFRGAPVWTVRLTVTHADGRTREARYVLDVGG
jgi:subtilisin family serine protease